MSCLDGRGPGQIDKARGCDWPTDRRVFSLSTPPRLILALGQDAMPDSDQQFEIEAPEELLADMPLPSDAKTFCLSRHFLSCDFDDGLMQPALRALERLRAPKALGASLLILVVIATIVGLGAAVSGPAEAWIAKLPEGIPRILERLRFPYAPVNTLRTFLAAANSFGAAGPQRSSPGPLDGGAILSSVFAGTRSFAGGLFTIVMFLYFLLVSGTISYGAWSRSCPGLPAGGRRSTSRSKSDAILPPISSQLP
jgi:hypothetical protein